LTPYGGDTPYYQGETLKTADFILPENFVLELATETTPPRIYNKTTKTYVQLTTINGTPCLADRKGTTLLKKAT
jgi:hypothetical protein